MASLESVARLLMRIGDIMAPFMRVFLRMSGWNYLHRSGRRRMLGCLISESPLILHGT